MRKDDDFITQYWKTMHAQELYVFRQAAKAARREHLIDLITGLVLIAIGGVVYGAVEAVLWVARLWWPV